MTNVKQRKIIVTVSVIIAFALSLLMLTVFDPFKTTAAEITPETFSVEMAQVRQHITEDTQGGYLRFVVRVGNGVYDTYGIDNHTYGTLLLPEDRLGDNELTFDTAMVLDIPAVKWQLADDDYHTYTAVLKGAEGDDVIPESYYNRPIVARAYIKNNATGEVQYSEHLSRSIGYVATMNVATGSGNEILTGIANGTNKSVEFDKTTLVNNADSLIPNIVFGGVSVPEDQLSNLDITYSTNGDGVTSDDTNVIKPNGHGEATVTATLNIPGFESIETTEVTIASHELVDHDAIAASCDAKGTVAHWSCSACGKNYSDANAVNELASTSVAVLGHSYEEAYRMDATYTEKGWIFKACTRCKDEISILNGNMLGHSISQSTVTLIENTNVFGSALNEQGGTEFAIQGTSLDKATWQSVAALMTNTQRGYLADGTTTFYPSFFRFEIDVDFTKNETTSFKVGVSTISSNSTAPEIIFGGVPVKFAEANTWYDVVVYSDGSVYFNGTLVAGATLTGNSIVFEFDNNRTSTTSHNHYGTFYIGEAVEVVAETREYDLGLGDVTGEPISAIGGSALTFWTAPAVAEKTVSGVKQNVISQDIQVYKDGNDKVEWNYFRYTLEINYKQFESITIPVATNVITNGAFDIYVGGVKGVITTGNAWSYITVMKDGSVYFNGTLMEGALVNDYIIIELDSHRPSGTFYGQFYIGTPTFTIKGSASKWESLDIDLGANANGTKTDGNIGYEEDKLGITSVTEFTFAAWQHSAFATLDLTDYEMVKFYLYRPSENGGGAVYDQGNGGSDGGIIYLSDAEYVDTWVEIILKKSIYGDYYNLYVNGERQRFTLKSGEQLTNLKQLALNGSSGKIKYSDVKVVPIPVTEPVWESVGMDKYNIASSMTNGTKADGSVTDTEAALGITSVKEFTITGWANASFAELNLLSYDEVKFYMQGTAGSIRTNSDGGLTGVIATLNNSWQEIRLVKNSAGTGFDVYVNGTLSTIKFYTDNKKTTEIPLTNMKQFALNGSSGTVKYSNIQVVDNSTKEKWDALDYNPTSSMTNGTKTDGSVTDTETELGITSVKEFTITSWGNQSFAELNLLSYDEVKFYIQGTSGSIRTNSDGGSTGVITTLNSSWQEIRLVKNSAGTGFDVYVNGTLSAIKFYTDSSKTTEIPLTNMKQFALNGSSGTVKFSNLMTPYVPPFEYEANENYNIASSMTNGTKTDGSVTDTETELGITFVKEFTITGWGNTSFAELNLLSYDEVKFYMQGTAGSIRTNSDGGLTGVIATLNNSWQEIRLVKNSAGTGFDVYVNGTLSTIKFYTDNKKTTEIPLTNMKQFALNGSSGTVKYSNIIVAYEGYYEEPEIEYDEEEVNDDYTIIFENGDTQVNYAAVELQAFFKEATGTLLFKEQYRGVNSLNGNIIVLGVLPATDKGFSFEGLGESDYVIKKDGSVIYIYGKTGYGVLNGVYALLGDLFELEIYYEDTYTLTKNEGFKITAEAVTEKTSSLTFDYIWSGLGELKPTEENGYSEDYAYQMGFATDYKITNTNVHNATTLLEEYRAAHPEWFYSEKGKNYGQIYLAAENFRTGEGTLVTTVAEKIFELLKEDTQYEREIALLFSAMDEDIWPHGTGYENSDALYNKYGTYAAENIMFMNAVAKELDRMIEAEPLGRTIQLDLLCYNKTLVAPELDGLSEADKAAIMMYKGTNISVIPLIAPVEGNRYLSFEDSRNKVKNPATGEIDSGSKTIAQVIEGWQALANGNDMHMWWYASDGFDFFVMMDTITNMQANYKFAAEHGITIMYNQSQGSNAVAPDWSRLKIYVQSQLQKDVNCDVDAVIDEWMDAYFGAGAGSMKTLLAAQKTWYASFFNAVFAENQGHYTAGGFSYSTDMAKWHFTENPSKPTFSFWDKTDDGMLDTWMGYIKEAKAAINADSNLTAEQKTELCNRVDLESLTIRYTLIEVFGTKTYDSSTSAFYQFAKSLGVTYSAEGKKIS